MLRWRLILGVLLIATFAALCWFDGNPPAALPYGWLLIPVALMVTLLASQEYVSLLRSRDWNLSWLLLIVGNLAIAGSVGLFTPFENYFVHPWGEFRNPIFVFLAAAVTAWVIEIFRYDGSGRNTIQVALTTLGLTYIGLGMAMLVKLRFVEESLLPLLAMIATVKMADIGAYTVGRLFGRHKMAPLLSPGKTWEGAAGALAFGLLASWLTIDLWPRYNEAIPPLRISWIAHGLLLAPIGIFGDLAESMIKRDVGRKDSSTWMPGFGGVLDIVDSLLLAAPVAYLLWTFWPN